MTTPQASCIRSSTVVALKVYPKVRTPASCACALPCRRQAESMPAQKSLSELNHIQVQRELDIHGRLHHANVLELYAVFEDADAYYFVMQSVQTPLLATDQPRRG